jgi:hypothetical protein
MMIMHHDVIESFCRLSEKAVFRLLLLDVSSLEVKLSQVVLDKD